MTVKSARAQLEHRSFTDGICMPTAIDSMLPISELPDEYYDLCAKNYHDPNGSHNKQVSYLLKEFFNVDPQPDTDMASIAKFNAFGASPQVYMQDAPYDYPNEKEYFINGGVTAQQFRFIRLLSIARDNGCTILFTRNRNRENEHVLALHMINEGKEADDAVYVVRNFVAIQGDKTYNASNLAGIPQTLGSAEKNTFAPLPTVERSYFPNGQASWELIILPPDPRL